MSSASMDHGSMAYRTHPASKKIRFPCEKKCLNDVWSGTFISSRRCAPVCSSAPCTLEPENEKQTCARQHPSPAAPALLPAFREEHTASMCTSLPCLQHATQHTTSATSYKKALSCARSLHPSYFMAILTQKFRGSDISCAFVFARRPRWSTPIFMATRFSHRRPHIRRLTARSSTSSSSASK